MQGQAAADLLAAVRQMLRQRGLAGALLLLVQLLLGKLVLHGEDPLGEVVGVPHSPALDVKILGKLLHVRVLPPAAAAPIIGVEQVCWHRGDHAKPCTGLDNARSSLCCGIVGQFYSVGCSRNVLPVREAPEAISMMRAIVLASACASTRLCVHYTAASEKLHVWRGAEFVLRLSCCSAAGQPACRPSIPEHSMLSHYAGRGAAGGADKGSWTAHLKPIHKLCS